MVFIRKIKTASGATAVQVAYKQKGRIIKIVHIISAHNNEELSNLVTLARKQLQENQLELFPEAQSTLWVGIRRSFSGLLWNTQREQYRQLGFDQLDDVVFNSLSPARLKAGYVEGMTRP